MEPQDDPDDRQPARSGKSRKKPRVVRKMTEPRLANIALHYLERYSSSAENLRRVLERRVYKSLRAHPDLDEPTTRGWIDTLIERYLEVGLLDDQAYAQTRTRSMLDRGEAPRSIAMKLAQKGINADGAKEALSQLEQDFPEPELQAALTVTRKKRLGPYRDPEMREEKRDRDLAALARSGFSYDTAKKMIDAEDVPELEAMLEELLNGAVD
ncbi:MAG: regulatory protein RecX [Rhodospirillaceae bacterium]|nr:regulatory protein RecX [Rhodospirillaceae bacterium]